MPAATVEPHAVLDAAIRLYGLDDETAARVLAIARAESGLDAHAQHRNLDGSTDYGLMQINSVHLKSGGRLAGWPVEGLLTVEGSIKAAKIISNDWRDWRPWVTFVSGRYLLDIDWARKEVKAYHGATDPSVAGALTGLPVDQVSSLASGTMSVLGSLTSPQTWLRVAYVIVGGGLVLAGLASLAGAAKPVAAPVLGPAGKAIKAAKAAKGKR